MWQLSILCAGMQYSDQNKLYQTKIYSILIKVRTIEYVYTRTFFTVTCYKYTQNTLALMHVVIIVKIQSIPFHNVKY